MSDGIAIQPQHPRLSGVRAEVPAVQAATLAVAGITVLAAVLRFVGLGHQSFWYDESFTAMLVRHTPGAMLGLLPKTELTPPLYYLMAWVWAHVFGSGEAGLRSLSALAGVATIPVLYAAAAKLVSRRAGLIAAALAACNPLLIWYSQEARSYSVLVLFATFSLWAFAHARLPGASSRRLAAWSLAAALTIGTHYYGVLIVAPEAAWLLWVHRRDRRILAAVGVVVAVGGGLLPLALSQQPQASWIAPWSLVLRLQQIPSQFLLGTGAPARAWLEPLGGAMMILCLALLAWRADSSERRAAALAGSFSLAGLAIGLLLIVGGVDELITRNVIVILIPLTIVAAAGFGARRAGPLGVAGAVVVCAIGISAAVAVAADATYQRPNWRGLISAIGADKPADSGRMLLMQRYVFLMPLAVDMPGLHFSGPHGTKVTEVDVVSIDSRERGWFCWWGSSCNLLSSDLDRRIHIPGFRRYGRVLHAAPFSILRLRATHPVRVTPRTVRRALARSPIRAPHAHAPNLPPGFGPPYSYGLLIQPPA